MSFKDKIHHEPGDPGVDVWIIHSERKILITDIPGPPAAICGYLSETAAKSAQERGYATVSEIGFNADDFLGSWPLPTYGWGEALKQAEAKAKELCYTLDYHSSQETYDCHEND